MHVVIIFTSYNYFNNTSLGDFLFSITKLVN